MGKHTRHRGDRRRSARRRHRDRGRAVRPRLRRVHGRGRRRTAGAQRVPHEEPRRRRRAGHERQRDAQGRDQRSAPRLGRDRRHARTTASDRSSGRIRTRGWCASSSASSATKRARSAAPSSVTDPDLVVACVGGGSNAIGTFAGFLDTERAARRRRGRRSRPRVRSARRVGEPRRARRAARVALALPPGRRRPDPRGALDQRRARLSRASAPSTPQLAADGTGRVRVRDRRRSRRRVPAAVGHRGHRARAGAGARDRLARRAKPGARCRRDPPCSSRSRAAATRTPRRSPSASRASGS